MGEPRVCALRGATTAPANRADEIQAATAELLGEMLNRNRLAPGDLISIIFTTTPDLDAGFPAAAARGAGLSGVPLLCAQEIDVPGSLARCIRVLIHLYSDRAELEHVYLRDAVDLRAGLAGEE